MPGPRSRASVPDALPAAARRAGPSWRRTRSGPCPRRRRPAAGRRPDPCPRWRTHRRDLRRPKGRRSPSWPPAVPPLGQLSDPLHGAIQFRLHRIALALLERGVDPADRFLTPLLEPEDLYAQLARQKHRLVTQKPRNDLTLARHRPSLAKQRACRQSLASLARPQAHQQQLSSQLSVIRSSLDTSIKPILCPRKSGPTHPLERAKDDVMPSRGHRRQGRPGRS